MPKPISQDDSPNCTLHHGDCLQILPTLKSSSVDLVLCDPPYGTTQCAWDCVIDLSKLWKQLRRIITPTGAIVLTASQPFTSALIMSAIDIFKYEWIWKKSRPGDIFNAKNKPLKSHENICVFSLGTTANGSQRRMVYNPIGVGPGGVRTNNPAKNVEYAFKSHRPSHIKNPITQGSNYPRSVLKIGNPNAGSLHPTQKPVELFKYLIETYSQANGMVLDFAMGSGTTGVACKILNRQFIGIEITEQFYKIAEQRIETTNA